jgi:Tol biopolymer transport system component
MPLVALSHAPRGVGTPYQGIDLVDVHSGAIRNVSRAECMAFFWSPDGQWILQGVVDADQNCLAWYLVPTAGGEPTPLGSFWPTRDVLFYLHFFDQYASSHPMISADGRHIAFAGYPAGGGQADLSAPPRVWVRAIDGGAAEAIAEGSFAVWSPA